MAKGRCKLTTWTYTDEVTQKKHSIQVYTVGKNEEMSFEAEVTHPVKFTDHDKNFQALLERVMARCRDGQKTEWKPYVLVTASHEGFERDPVDFSSVRRNYYGIGLLFETFETTVLSNNTRLWRGIAGKSTRFSSKAEPGWPKAGKSERSVSRPFPDTPENQESFRELVRLFSQVARILTGIGVAKNIAALPNAIRMCQAFHEDPTPCPNTDLESSSVPSAPDAAVPAAPTIAGSSPAI